MSWVLIRDILFFLRLTIVLSRLKGMPSNEYFQKKRLQTVPAPSPQFSTSKFLPLSLLITKKSLNPKALLWWNCKCVFNGSWLKILRLLLTCSSRAYVKPKMGSMEYLPSLPPVFPSLEYFWKSYNSFKSPSRREEIGSMSCLVWFNLELT